MTRRSPDDAREKATTTPHAYTTLRVAQNANAQRFADGLATCDEPAVLGLRNKRELVTEVGEDVRRFNGDKNC